MGSLACTPRSLPGQGRARIKNVTRSRFGRAGAPLVARRADHSGSAGGRAYDRLTHVLETPAKGQAPGKRRVSERGVLEPRGDRPHRRAELRGRGALPVVRRAPPGGPRVLASRGDRPAGRLLGRHPLRRLRARQPGLGALLLRPSRRPLPRNRRGTAGPAAAVDAQHGPDHAHALPPPGQQGLHPQDGARPRAADHRVRRRHHRHRVRARPLPTSSKKWPPSSPSSSSPSCWACPRRIGAWSSTGPIA